MSRFHKFKLGQHVDLISASRARSPTLGKFEIIRLMPAEHGMNQYRIRSLLDGHERMAAEIELE
jgi:hypothetical protein